MQNLILSPFSVETLVEANAKRTVELLASILKSNKNNSDSETLLSKQEACDLLGITMNTLSKHIKNGTIPAYGIGSRVVLKRTEVLSSLVRVNK